MAFLELGARTESSITLRLAGLSNPATSSSYDYIAISKMTSPTETNPIWGSVNYSDGNGYYTANVTFSGLSPGTSYDFRGDATPTGSYMRSYYGVFSTTNNRPNNFSWTNIKSSEAAYNLTPAEWNAFLNKVNEFRTFKNLAAYSFDRTIIAAGINQYVVPTANSFNSARNAISDMNPSVSLPGFASSGETITAYHLNRIKDSLNSIQ